MPCRHRLAGSDPSTPVDDDYCGKADQALGGIEG